MVSACRLPACRVRAHPGRAVRARDAGFTLIELLIAMAVLAILATIAYPTYGEFVMRSRIVDATSGMNDFRTRMEQSFQDRRDYSDGAAGCGVVPPANDNFTLTCVLGAGGTSYTLTADGIASMSAFSYDITVGPAGVLRTTQTVAPGWSLPSPNTCWAVRKNGYCS